MAEVSPTLALWVALAALPLVLTLATAFTKSIVVLGALRVGLSAEALMPWPAVLAVATLATAIIMAPVASASWTELVAHGGIETVAQAGPEAWLAIADPLVAFVTRHASEAEIDFFAQLQERTASDPLVILPAFLITELTEALTMAVVILLPLVLTDLLIAQVLILLGLTNQPPTLVTLPAKILLFLGVGGFDIVVGGLVEGYL